MTIAALSPPTRLATLLALFLLALLAAPRVHAVSSDPWDGDVHPSFMFYAWLPGVTADLRYEIPPTAQRPGGIAETRSTGNIYDNIAGAFMMAGDVRVGDWGFFGDLAWVKFDNEDGRIRDFDGQHVDASLSTRWNLKAGVVTLAGLYSLSHGPDGYLDLVFGGRYLSIKTNVKWDFIATGGGDIIGDIENSGKVSRNAHSGDAIIGLRGQWTLGGGPWYVPYYIDVGTGSSDLTTAATLGVGYLFDWGNVAFVWRDLRYKQSGDTDLIHRLNLDGPMFNIGWQF